MITAALPQLINKSKRRQRLENGIGEIVSVELGQAVSADADACLPVGEVALHKIRAKRARRERSAI